MVQKRTQLEVYSTQDGAIPLAAWLHGIKDSTLVAEILSGVDSLVNGDFTDCRSIGGGLFEKRISLYPPLRVFFALVGKEGLLLLTGTSDTSKKDGAEQALKIWKEFKQDAH
jgi:putative addiction module killer protein